jgi:hypothetical protein
MRVAGRIGKRHFAQEEAAQPCSAAEARSTSSACHDMSATVLVLASIRKTASRAALRGEALNVAAAG